ncbi:MAG: HD domain-containing protein, partial [Clostridia bacterium]|nr:HD domain-containing protein [Clostridia bacterium]
PLMASQYHYRKRAFIIVLIATILLVPIAVYGSFFLGAPDRNFLKGEITETEAMVLANRIPLATTKRMTELFTHYTLPLLFGVIVIVLLVTGITRRNGKMLRIQTELSEKIREEMENRNKAQNQVIEMLTSLIETRDVSTGTHILRTKTIVELIAKAMQKEPDYRDILTDETIERMVQAAPLHDIGKIIVSDSILLKPAKLTPEEFETMKKHTTVGGKLVKKLFLDMNDPAFLQMAEDIALCHHEKWDGTGYPCGLKKDAIPLCARIMAVADVYDALVSARVYKPAFPPEEALKILFSENATRFDPDIMKVVEKIKDDLKALADTSRNGTSATGTDVSA